MRLLIASFVASGLIAGQGTVPKGTPVPPTTAKVNVTVAIAAAKKWKADAILTQIGGSRTVDGKRVSWDYGFYSASSKLCALVQAFNGQALARPANDAGCEKVELKEFMDSDQAIGFARKNGVSKPQNNMMLSVVKGKPAWMVADAGGVASGDVIVFVDAATGALIDKIRQQ